ncbi:hypothetical protein ACWD3I_26005 [Streptomyces sp. NPDC002817]|uniref:hypothetical protein n=1 Tax=Streptomyces sp. NPDC088357 TaxID=3154655 RepID=UPI003441F535
MRVTVFHNMVSGYRSGYRPEHPMLPVYAYDAPDGPVEDQLWRAVMLFNGDPEFFDGEDRGLCADYRDKHQRSFSPGDGFSVVTGGSTQFWVSNGRSLDPLPGGFPSLAVDGDHGSVPIGQQITYMIPDFGHLVREGLFEACGPVHRTAQSAVALFHEVDPRDVVILAIPS